MTELTDLEICKRIAEIEGFLTDPDDKYPRYLRFKSGEHVGYKTYNPLTDDALCFKLMVKYKIQLRKVTNGDGWSASFNKLNHSICTLFNTSPNKAICLAIIEAHK
mgnify:FL=1